MHPKLEEITNAFLDASRIDLKDIAKELIEEFGLPFVNGGQITAVKAEELCSRNEEDFIKLYSDSKVQEVIETLQRKNSDIVWMRL
ncbi:MAG: hypothetical protein WC180_02845 [Candidatus Paceibacterota bacterium]|jgi:hypothetical protein